MSQPGPDVPRQYSSTPFLLLLAALFTFLLYLPGSNGPFLHDDHAQITTNDALKISELTRESLARADDKYPSRPLPMISFALNYYQCGPLPACYKITNIALHLSTGLAALFLLWSLGRAGERQRLFAMPTAVLVGTVLLWQLHPLQVSTTLYVVQRMAIMATLFSLLALACYVQARMLAGGIAARAGWTLAALLFGWLAWLSKENAVLILPLILLVELLLLPQSFRQRLKHPWLIGAALASLFFLVLYLLAEFPFGRLARSYIQRDFLPMERLLTEARILWLYASEILWPDAARMNFHVDYLALSRSLLDPPATLVAVAGWWLVLALALGQILRRASLPAFGVLFFAAGHLLESTVYGLVLAYEHRNYLASIGPMLLVACLVWELFGHARLRTAVFVLLLGLLSWQLSARVATWASDTSFANHLLQPRWENSYGSQMTLGRYFSTEARQLNNPGLSASLQRQARAAYERASALTPQPILPLQTLLTRAGTPDEADIYWQRLQEAARTGPVTPDALNAANTMALCLLVEACPLSADQYAVFIDHLLANPRKNRTTTTLLRRTAGTFFVKIRGETEKGLELSRLAAASGMPLARESYIKNLGFLGRREEAEAAYAEFAREVDLPADQRQRIEAAIAAPGVVLP